MDRLNNEKNEGKETGFDQIKQILDPASSMSQMMVNLLQTASPGMKEGIKMVLVKSVASGRGPAMDKAAQEIVIDARNQSVMDTFAKTIKKDAPPKSIAIFWGAAHMPGLEKDLAKQYGYKPTDIKWFPAASADPSKLDASGKMIVDMFEKQAAPPKKDGGRLKLLAALNPSHPAIRF